MTLYNVDSVKQTSEITGAGDIRPVFEITFTTVPGGAVGQVKVPTSLSADEIAAAIQPEADKLESLFTLGG